MRCIACKWAYASMVCYLVVLQLIIQRHESFYTVLNHPCRVFVYWKSQMPKNQHATCVAAIFMCTYKSRLEVFSSDPMELRRKWERWTCLELVTLKKKKNGVHVRQTKRRRRNKTTRTAQWKQKSKRCDFVFSLMLFDRHRRFMVSIFSY